MKSYLSAFFIVSFLLTISSFADAVTAADKGKGIQLSEKAKMSIGITTRFIQADLSFPKSALIQERGKYGVYLKHGDWYCYQEIELKAPSLHSGDEIVVSGVALLRLAEINALSTTEGADND